MRRPTRFLALATMVAMLAATSSSRADEPAPGAPPTEVPSPTAPAVEPTPLDPAVRTDPSASASPSASPAQPVVAPDAAPVHQPVAAPVVEREKDPKDEVPRPSGKLVLGLGVGGAVLLVTGIVLGSLAKARSDEQEGNPDAPPLYDESLASRARQGDRLATAAYVMFGVGGALAIADVVLLVERYRKPAKKKDATHASVPTVVPRLTGLQVSF